MRAVIQWSDMGRGAPFLPDALRAWGEPSTESAKVILPLVFALSKPESVIDVGCLYGAWAETCRELGVDDVIGVDAGYIDRDSLLIPPQTFLTHDLGTPLRMNRTFDLAISLEVAHYLPEDRAAGFVADLCALAQIVLFSAAIPYQVGVGHVNQQWPAYWVDRFSNEGYTVVDCIRDEVWDDPAVGWWYAQNALLFVSSDIVSPAITEHPGFGRSLARVHPGLLMTCNDPDHRRLTRRMRRRLAELRHRRARFRLSSDSSRSDS